MSDIVMPGSVDYRPVRDLYGELLRPVTDLYGELLAAHAAVVAERDRLRAALEDMREWVDYRQNYSVVCREVLARIDAALKGPDHE